MCASPRVRPSTISSARCPASACSDARRASSVTRRPRGSRSAASGRAARAAPSCCSTASRSTTPSGAGCTGTASRSSPSTRSSAFAAGGRLRAGDFGELAAAVYGHFQEFRSTFSSQALDRNSETLVLDQTVPSTSAGGYLQWSRRFGAHLLASGGDIRWVDGETQEKVYNAAGGAFLRTRIAGGEQVIGGVFLQDVYTPDPAWELVGGIRGDYWESYHGTRRDTPAPAGLPSRQTFTDIDRILASPRIAALFHATSSTDLRASAYQGFRVPTIN